MRSRGRKTFEASGNLYFVTTTVVGFINLFYCPELYQIIIDNLRFYQNRGDFIILAYVLMPNHFHLVVKVEKNKSISDCMASLKRITSRKISEYLKRSDMDDLMTRLANAAMLEPASDSKIWKPRFDCLVIINEAVLKQKIDYIHNNPIRRKLAKRQEIWRYSSASNYAGLTDVTLEVDVNWKCLGY